MEERLYIYIMKRILFLIVCLLLVRMANAQKNSLALDEHNKYIYYQVVDQPGAGADSLARNAASFIKEYYPKIKPGKISDTSITVKDKFVTYTVAAFVKHESGVINYTLVIECKDAKYRFWLTDFVFTPYERDRYGAFVPVNGKQVPLESASSKIEKKDLVGYLDQTGAYSQQLGDKLKLYMTQDHHAKKTQPKPVKKIVTDKW